MQRVAVLSHVKASSVPASSFGSNGARRIPWQGGKISSNKAEALQKFYQRKLQAGDHLTAQQVQAMQKSLGTKPDAQGRRVLSSTLSNPKKLHHTHAKVTAGNSRTVLKTGRVLGPKLQSPHARQPRKSESSAKMQRPVNKSKSKSTFTSMPKRPTLALEDKLGMSLDALVGGSTNKIKRNGAMKRR